VAASGRARGRAGEMSDAAEVLGAIYDSLRAAPGGGALVDAVFGLHVAERVHCAACGRDTHASAYTQYFYNASATALRLQARARAAARSILGPWQPDCRPPLARSVSNASPAVPAPAQLDMHWSYLQSSLLWDPFLRQSSSNPANTDDCQGSSTAYMSVPHRRWATPLAACPIRPWCAHVRASVLP
jgi:hypothetical protein